MLLIKSWSRLGITFVLLKIEGGEGMINVSDKVLVDDIDGK